MQQVFLQIKHAVKHVFHAKSESYLQYHYHKTTEQLNISKHHFSPILCKCLQNVQYSNNPTYLIFPSQQSCNNL